MVGKKHKSKFNHNSVDTGMQVSESLRRVVAR